MMLYVYLTIVALVLLTYRDWRAIDRLLPAADAGDASRLLVHEGAGDRPHRGPLPVMVLPSASASTTPSTSTTAAGHPRPGSHRDPFKQALRETGIATIFTALTLSVGVATWSFSELKFQADMGLLLTFMFMVNMLMAITLLRRWPVMIDVLVPRRRPLRAPFLSH